jgi:RND family efflux transporter MFP subunit
MDHRVEGRQQGVRFLALKAALPLAIACLLVIGCDKQEQETPEVIRPVKMMTIGASSAGGVREFPGQVRAAEEIELSFEVQGRIIQLNAREGSTVANGALVAALDPRDYEAARDRELARRNEARADYERNRTLYERDAISLRDLEVVRRQFEVAEANLRQAEKSLEDTRLYAPFDGKIAGRLVENQENVQAKQPVVVFHDDSSLEIRASFSETDFLRIRDLGTVKDMTERLKPTVEISASSGAPIDAWVKELRTTADPVTRTYDVVLGFDPPAATSITSGMTARVIITLAATKGAMLIPSSAVVSDSELQSRVWVYDQAAGAVNAREVVVGSMTGDDIEILSGLEDGDTIAILGASNLTEGMKVRPLGD